MNNNIFKIVMLGLLILQAMALKSQVVPPTLHFQYEACTNCVGTANNNATIYNYGNLVDFSTNHIVSDFGGRQGINFHKGVDFSPEGGDADMGDHVNAIVGGTVHTISAGAGYKYININGAHDFGYGHIFRSAAVPAAGYRTGNTILKRMDGVQGQQGHYAIIHATATDTVAIATTAGNVTYNNTAFAVVTNVGAGDVIGGMGDSYGGGALDAHIHLYRYLNINNGINLANCKDPLEVVIHTQPQYTITLDDLDLTHDGSQATTIKLRTEMVNADQTVTGACDAYYNSATMNIDNVSIVMKKDYEPNTEFEFIKGPSFESYISLGARMTSTRYPSPGHPAHNANIDIGSNNRSNGTMNSGTRKDPGAYCNHPYDDFYFGDFYTRIHKDDPYSNAANIFARFTPDARYPDGRYNLVGSATTVTNAFHANDYIIISPLPSNPTYDYNILIDNFKPYVETVRVFAGNEEAYFGKWEATGPNNNRELQYNHNVGLGFLEGIDPNNTDPNYTIRIEVFTSEPMTEVHLRGIEPLSPIEILGTTFTPDEILVSNVQTPVTSHTDNRKKWVFVIPNSAFARSGVSGVYLINISGTDLSGNSILGYHRPNLEGLGQMLGLNDQLESPVDIPMAQFPYRTGANSWSANGPGTNFDRVHGMIIGSFCTDGPGLVESDESKAKGTDGKSFSSDCLDFSFNASNGTTFSNVPASVNFTATIDIDDTGTAPYTYNWDFGNGTTMQTSSTNSTSNSQNNIVYNQAGTYTISVTVEDANGLERTKVETDYIVVYDPSSPTNLNVSFTAFPNPTVNTTPVQFTPSVTGGIPPYSYYWDFGDGGASINATPSHLYPFTGSYTVSLTVTDGQSNSAVYTYPVTVTEPFDPKFRIVGINHAAKQGIFEVYNLGTSIYQLDWNFGDNTTATSSTSYLEVHNYHNTGTYTVSVQVTDIMNPGNSKSFSETFDILPYLAANFNCPSDPANPSVIPQGSTYTFVNSSNSLGLNPNDGVYEYKWIVTPASGGGSTSTNWSTTPNYTHTFPNQGFYEVKLRIRLNKPGNTCWGPYCRAETTCVVEVGPCGNNNYWLPKEPRIFYYSNTVTRLTGNGLGCDDSKLAVKITENSLLGIWGVDTSNYDWTFEAYRIKTNGKDKKEYDIIRPFNLSENEAVVLFDWNEFNNDNGDEQYYVRVIIEENGCGKKIFTDQLLCLTCNGGVHHNDLVPCPFEWDEFYNNNCNKETDFVNTWPNYGTTRLIDQTRIDRYDTRDAYVFNGTNIESDGSVHIVNNDTVSFVADTEVRLKPGFEAKAGSSFWAKLEEESDCFVDYNMPLVEDGTSEFEETEEVLLAENNQDKEVELNLYPNPAAENEEVIIDFWLSETQKCGLRIINSNGQLIRSSIIPGVAGSNLAVLATEILAPGMYFIQLQTDGELITKKLIIQSTY